MRMGKTIEEFNLAVADASRGQFERLKEFGIRSKRRGDQVVFTFTASVKNDSKEITNILFDWISLCGDDP